jgi:hypothetical protein
MAIASASASSADAKRAFGSSIETIIWIWRFSA